MREIKFRVWDSVDKKMVDWSTLKSLPPFLISKQKHYKPMQYTGLKDKSGVEIYEGDICKNENGRLAKAICFDCGACFDFIALNGADDSFGYDAQMAKYKLTVIGNIYESPELL